MSCCQVLEAAADSVDDVDEYIYVIIVCPCLSPYRGKQEGGSDDINVLVNDMSGK